EHRVVLGDLDRVVGRDQRRRGGEDEALGGGGDVGEEGRRRGAEEGRVVVLADREDVEPDFLGLLRDLHRRVDPLRLARGLARGRVAGDVADREDSELHVDRSFAPWKIYATASTLAHGASGPGWRRGSTRDQPSGR